MNEALDFITRAIANLQKDIEDLQTVDASPITARVGLSTSQTINDSTWTPIEFDTVEFDTRGAVGISPNFQYTVPVAGYYQVGASIGYPNSANWTLGEYLAIGVAINSALDSYLSVEYPYAASHTPVGFGSTLIKADKGDILEIMAFQNSGSTISIYGNSPLDVPSSRCWLYRVRGY